MMNKRGSVADIVSSPLFYLVVGAAVFIVVMGSIGDIGGSGFKKRFFAADVALSLDAIQAVPREVNVAVGYSFPFGVSVEPLKREVRVFENDFSDGRSGFFSRDDDVVFLGETVSLMENKGVWLFKNGNNVGVSRDFPSLSGFYCPRHIGSLGVTFVSSGGNAVVDGKPESSLIGSLLPRLRDPSLKQGEVVISLGVGSRSDNVAVFYVNGNQASINAACQLARRLSSLFDGVAIVPVGRFASGVLASNEPAVVVELGGSSNNPLSSRLSLVSELIVEGVRDV